MMSDSNWVLCEEMLYVMSVQKTNLIIQFLHIEHHKREKNQKIKFEIKINVQYHTSIEPVDMIDI